MNQRQRTPPLPLRLGCPVFNCEHWADEVYPQRTPQRDRLLWYSQMFNTVEGNSTFYGLPSLTTVKRWCEESAPGFQFCLKFPRALSHELALVGGDALLDEFLEIVETLAQHDRLGPSFLQLGPQFAPNRLPVLREFLQKLPRQFPWAVEVRHHDWFDQFQHENSLNDLLRANNIDKVLFDSRALFQSPADDEIEQASQNRKPRTPVRQTITAQNPMLRFVGRNQLDLVDPFIDQWAKIVAKWIRDGLKPYVFTHAPDDRHAPKFARRFWRALCEQWASPEQSASSPESSETSKSVVAEETAFFSHAGPSSWAPEDLPSLSPPPKQLGLFDDRP